MPTIEIAKGMRQTWILPVAVGLMACSLSILGPTPTPTAAPTDTPTPLPTPRPTALPGSDENPLILALAPTAHPDEELIAAGETLVGQLHQLTGYSIVAAQPTSEKDLLQAFAQDNAHIAMFSPFGYLQAREAGTAAAGLAILKDGETLYGAQFIANRDSEFESFFDVALGENTAEAPAALIQFSQKKPCWSDAGSPSGYVIPLGFLNRAGVQTRAGAFLEGQPPVVRAVYTEGICDFGATFIDARQSPALEEDYPDVLEKVVVIWRIPAIIPYESIAFSINLPLETRRVLVRAFVDVMADPEGKLTMQAVYGIDALQPAEENLYDDFETYAEASGVDLMTLLAGQ